MSDQTIRELENAALAASPEVVAWIRALARQDTLPKVPETFKNWLIEFIRPTVEKEYRDKYHRAEFTVCRACFRPEWRSGYEPSCGQEQRFTIELSFPFGLFVVCPDCRDVQRRSPETFAYFMRVTKQILLSFGCPAEANMDWQP